MIMTAAFSRAETDIIEENYATKSAREIAELMTVVSGIDRKASGVWCWAWKRDLKREYAGRSKKKHKQLIDIPVPRIKPTLKNSDLFELQEKYNIRLKDIARIGRLTLEAVQDYVNQGGLPEGLEDKLHIYIEDNPQRAN